MWVADTSWLFALFDARDAHHDRAMDEASLPGTLLVNATTLTEFLEVAMRRYGKAASVRALGDLNALPTVRFVPAPKTGSMLRVLEHGAGIGWFDASAIATAVEENAGLRTFDAAQAKAFAAFA